MSDKVMFGWCLLVALVLAMLMCFLHGAWATDDGQYENVPPEIRAWYHNAELTEAAKQRFPFKKCCDHSDVVHTKFFVDKSTGKDVWMWLNPQTNQFEIVPPDIIHWFNSAPNGKPTLFVYHGEPTCFFPPDGGV